MSHMTFKMVTFLLNPLILVIYLKSDSWDRVLNEPSLNEQGQFGLGSFSVTTSSNSLELVLET